MDNQLGQQNTPVYTPIYVPIWWAEVGPGVLSASSQAGITHGMQPMVTPTVRLSKVDAGQYEPIEFKVSDSDASFVSNIIEARRIIDHFLTPQACGRPMCETALNTIRQQLLHEKAVAILYTNLLILPIHLYEYYTIHTKTIVHKILYDTHEEMHDILTSESRTWIGTRYFKYVYQNCLYANIVTKLGEQGWQVDFAQTNPKPGVFTKGKLITDLLQLSILLCGEYQLVANTLELNTLDHHNEPQHTKFQTSHSKLLLDSATTHNLASLLKHGRLMGCHTMPTDVLRTTWLTKAGHIFEVVKSRIITFFQLRLITQILLVLKYFCSAIAKVTIKPILKAYIFISKKVRTAIHPAYKPNTPQPPAIRELPQATNNTVRYIIRDQSNTQLAIINYEQLTDTLLKEEALAASKMVVNIILTSKTDTARTINSQMPILPRQMYGEDQYQPSDYSAQHATTKLKVLDCINAICKVQQALDSDDHSLLCPETPGTLSNMIEAKTRYFLDSNSSCVSQATQHIPNLCLICTLAKQIFKHTILQSLAHQGQVVDAPMTAKCCD